VKALQGVQGATLPCPLAGRGLIRGGGWQPPLGEGKSCFPCSCLPPGTRIIYDRKFLMECRNSPVAKTPPSDLPDIPGVTSPNVEELKTENNHVQNCDEKVSAGECTQKPPEACCWFLEIPESPRARSQGIPRSSGQYPDNFLQNQSVLDVTR
uniref:Eukaryotic translation initiation factor 4E binding protein 1 n=1 Tax=Otus sunia TaxID=257818 RepID=A0A8C8A957_9STRI